MGIAISRKMQTFGTAIAIFCGGWTGPQASEIGKRICVQEILGSTRTNSCTRNSIMQVCETNILMEAGAGDKALLRKVKVRLTHHCAGVILEDSVFLKLGRKMDTAYFTEESCVLENGRMPNPKAVRKPGPGACSPPSGLEVCRLEPKDPGCLGAGTFTGVSQICVGQDENIHVWVGAKNTVLNSEISMQWDVAFDSIPKRIMKGDYEVVIE